MSRRKAVPIIDLFAGPGGLGEGFASLRNPDGTQAFRIAVSIEKDPIAHKTLRLRSFYRQFEPDRIPGAYYDFLRRTDLDQHKRWLLLKAKFPSETKAAEAEARNAELGKNDAAEIDGWIHSTIKETDAWVLIGGPPCQAYSLAGRSRNNGNPDYVPEKDKRQYLYKEYLRILATHLPPVFIMENVKGLLSATLRDELIFERILDDLRQPRAVLHGSRRNGNTRYRIFSLVKPSGAETIALRDFVVPMERYGIPQARHRVILLGVREDLGNICPGALKEQYPVTALDVLSGLPPLRSGLSKETDALDRWRSAVIKAPWKRWLKEGLEESQSQAANYAEKALARIQKRKLYRGAEYIHGQPSVTRGKKWYLDGKLDGVCNHSSRSHIPSDLHRYFYAAVFAQALHRSPTLADFPRELLPDHKNVCVALNGGHFSDRFRVQLATKPSTTITSHISKDGHYYIHYDPAQCRSLTVREAARLQTFPDNYFFCGPRTSQYTQVGNAVPPLLARHIAEIVRNVLKKAGAG